MPIEREFKYVLDHRNDLEAQLKDQGYLGIEIKQGYLSKGGRIRSKSYPQGHGFEGKTQFIFTYKHKLSSRPGCLEIEQNISEDDFNLAWDEADHTIDKVRYVIQGTDDPVNGVSPLVWEIDFFRDDNGQTYFALAECEVHQGQDRPQDVNTFVKEHLLLAVDENDGRFQNRKLSDVKRAGKLFKEALNGKA